MTEEPPVVICARGLGRRFGQLAAVDDLNLDIHRGEVFGFLGPNGAGKSTLIRMLTGLLRPSTGTVHVLGLELPRDAERLRPRVGYMTQRFSLYEDLSIEENLEFAAEVFGLEGGERRHRVAESLAEHDLEERRLTRPATLSGGWKQRLALAVATIHRPELLLLDEPTAGVDPDRRRLFWQKLFELAADGTTVLVSTHYMDEAVRCHRLCVIQEGRRAALGRPLELTRELDGRVVEVATEEHEAAVAVLQQVSDVAAVTQISDRLHLLLKARPPVLSVYCAGLVQTLDAAGLTGASAEPTVPSLEDVLVALGMGEHFDHVAS